MRAAFPGTDLTTELSGPVIELIRKTLNRDPVSLTAGSGTATGGGGAHWLGPESAADPEVKARSVLNPVLKCSDGATEVFAAPLQTRCPGHVSIAVKIVIQMAWSGTIVSV